MAAAEVRVKGLRELQRACRSAEKATRTEVRRALHEVGGPVRERAESLAQSRIPTSGQRWSRMRVGSTMRTVYIAPAARRSGGSPRPNFGGLLMNRAMWPAVEQMRDQVEQRLEDALDVIGDIFERR